MQGFTAFLIYISIFVKQKGIAMKTTAEIIEILRYKKKNEKSQCFAFGSHLNVNCRRKMGNLFTLGIVILPLCFF